MITEKKHLHMRLFFLTCFLICSIFASILILTNQQVVLMGLTWVNNSVFNIVLPWCPVWGVLGVQTLCTVWCYPDHNWLQGLCHPLYLPHMSDKVMEQAAMETNFGSLPGIEPGTLRTRVQDLPLWHTALLKVVQSKFVKYQYVIMSKRVYTLLFEVKIIQLLKHYEPEVNKPCTTCTKQCWLLFVLLTTQGIIVLNTSMNSYFLWSLAIALCV